MMSASQTAAVSRSVVAALLENGASRATKFISESETITAKRVLWKGKLDKRERRVQVALSFGRPNYAERGFIRRCKKAGEPFPVKKIQLKFPTR
jgi:hypothetical protein